MNNVQTSPMISSFEAIASKTRHAEESVIFEIDLKDLRLEGMENKVTEVVFAELVSFSRKFSIGSLKFITHDGYSIMAFYQTECSGGKAIPHLFHSNGGCFVPSYELTETKALWLIARALMIGYRY